jgi:2-polyprenyl-3-methyl-5-hydroxy-6-metoxy-1,4-benzoquinol methylase
MIMPETISENARIAEVKAVFEDAQWYLTNRSYHVRVRVDVVREFLAGEKFGSILDIGCGDGSISAPFLHADSRLTLLDLSSTMLGIARSRVPAGLAANVETFNEDFMRADLGPRRYDLIICVGVMAYIEDEKAFVKKLSSLLNPGGKLITECTDSRHFKSRLARSYDWARNFFTRHKTRLITHSSDEVIGKFLEAGFQLAGAYRYSSPARPVRKLFKQEFHYKMIRAIYGDAAHNRISWLGNECIFYFKKPGA